jgi:excisionase family DNA binding protein
MAVPEERLLLSRADAAAALAISTDTLARLVKSGELGVVKVGRSVLIPREDVVALIERRRGMPRRPRRPKCSRCRERITGPRLVVGGLWICSKCMYEIEHGVGPDGVDQGDRPE